MTEKKWDVYIYGDVNIDLVIPGVKNLPRDGEEDEVKNMDTFVGGGAALFALGVGTLGLNPVFQGKVGDDLYGSFIVDEFTKKNVDCSLLVRDSHQKTGISISFTNEKDRAFLTYRGTNGDLNILDVDISKVKQAKHIHITGYEGSLKHESYLNLIKKVKEETKASVSFDVGWDTTGEWSPEIYELFPYIDVLFMNESEALNYSRASTAKDAAEQFSQKCKTVVIKMGSSGALAVSKNQYNTSEAFKVKAVDTTGAGDSFNAGFIYGFLKGYSIGECLITGNACGALNVTAYGGNTGFPNEDKLHQFIKDKKERVRK